MVQNCLSRARDVFFNTCSQNATFQYGCKFSHSQKYNVCINVFQLTLFLLCKAGAVVTPFQRPSYSELRMRNQIILARSVRVGNLTIR